MDKDLKKKDIHSKKVCKIMGEKPPISIQYGTTIIATLLFTMAIVAFYIIR